MPFILNFCILLHVSGVSTTFNQAVLQGILNLKVLTFQECFDLMRMARDVLRLQK